MNDPLFSRLCLPESSQIALYEIDEALSFLQAQRTTLLEDTPGMAGVETFSVALDTFDEAFQRLLESQQWEEKKT